MGWIIAGIVVVAILIFAIVLASKRRTRPNSFRSQKPALPRTVVPPTSTRESPSRLSAAEMLSRVQRLRDGNAQWDAIWSALNPADEGEVQRLLVEIRGPHMFAPHLGLCVIEDGCKRALALSPNADALAALREAIRSQEPFVQ
jgi:hypothetical protein